MSRDSHRIVTSLDNDVILCLSIIAVLVTLVYHWVKWIDFAPCDACVSIDLPYIFCTHRIPAIH